ncbi:hypothetical protein LTR56_020801 [Elasticomyces elasticus]|nr:hypothetical protein LTR22_024943 [Elasticomyces elasticus]KAK3624748.1 hypothetical protein LTR56_020801 [Elasticomyces elasticus]KAK4905213.1 hypothetical protein LTR49_025448 [Elasticomyces elasticus]KAK5739226.1 hypothetical protein LTS12_025356 [Elasticomyces elasticus]
MNMIIGMRRKREPPPPSTIHIFDTQLKRKPQKLSLLLDLPAELRNNVFATTGGVHLSSKGHRRALASSSRLTRVNKQVHDEFISAAWALADITTQALDLDFRHIVAFLNRLSDAELFAMPTNGHSVQRKMVIELLITEHYKVKLLRRWLNRIGNPEKKGTDLVYEYKLCSSRLNIHVEEALQTFEYQPGVALEGRGRKEYERICAAAR